MGRTSSLIHIVYRLRHRESGKCYIGKSSGRSTPRHISRLRFAKHIAAAAGDSTYAIHRAIRLHGHDSFVLRVLGVYKTEKEAFAAEIAAVAKYRSCTHDGGRGYNMTRGGDGVVGGRHAPETRARMSARKKELFEDPEFKAAHAARMRRLAADPDIAARRKAARRKMQDDPKYRASNAAHVARLAADPIVRKKISDSLKRKNADPAYAAARQKNTDRLRRWLADPKTRENNRRAVKAMHADPAYRAAMLASRKTPEFIARRKAQDEARRNDPVYMARFRAALKAAWARRKARNKRPD